MRVLIKSSSPLWQRWNVMNAAELPPQKRSLSKATRPTSLKFVRSSRTSQRFMRGEVYRLPARGKGHEQQRRRYAIVMQPDWLTLSTWIVAFTSTSARPTSFRPWVVVAERQTLVMCDQLATVDLRRLTEPAGSLAMAEMQRVNQALSLVMDL
jgi:mRNA interferase MazF